MQLETSIPARPPFGSDVQIPYPMAQSLTSQHDLRSSPERLHPRLRDGPWNTSCPSIHLSTQTAHHPGQGLISYSSPKPAFGP